MKIWLDDLRRPLPEFLWARSVGEAKALILECESRGEAPELISLDYELGEYELDGGKGIRLLEWLAERGRFYPVEVHSTHIYGAPVMEDFIRQNWPE